MSYVRTFEDRLKAARTLAAIALSELDVEISPEALMGLITGKWSRIAPLAHIIHSAPDNTKGGATAKPDGDGYRIVGWRYRYRDSNYPSDGNWRFSEHQPSGLNNIEVEAVYRPPTTP